MVSSTDALALERQLLDKYSNYPNVHTAALKTIPTTTGPMFQGGRNVDFLRNQILTNQSLQKKVFGLDELPDDGTDPHSKSSIIWWWEPPADSTPKDFFADSSMHGLKYLSQPKRHLCERIFWLVFFCTGVAAAAYLINGLWVRYKENPVIVSFEPQDYDIGRITFPAVTICSMNKLRKDMFETIKGKYSDFPDLSTGQDLYNAKVLCDGQKSFANFFDFAYERGRISLPEKEHYQPSGTSEVPEDAKGKGDNTANTAASDAFEAFVKRVTTPCSGFIRLCRWAGEKTNCSELFKDVITEYGRCCTFNGLPDHMIQKDLLNTSNSEEMVEFKQWEKWSEELLAPFILPDDWNYSNPFPKTQSRPGSQYGLSITLDADVSNYFCPSSDSEGFRIMFHSPAELPSISEFGMSVGLGHEIYMKVIPEPIRGDPEINSFNKKERMCMLRQEGNLAYYRHYTYSNCVDDCVSREIVQNCSCSFYYMMHNAKKAARPCDADRINKKDYNCSVEVKRNMTKTLRTKCDCDALCSDIMYRTETTLTKLQPISHLWEDFDPSQVKQTPEWASNQISIVHIFYGDAATVPKVRKALYGVTDIIANIGGLLGLCLGFSVLSAVEIVYFFTCRACLKRVMRKGKVDAENTEHGVAQTGGQLRRMVFGFGRSDPNEMNRVITLDPNALQMRPQYNM